MPLGKESDIMEILMTVLLVFLIFCAISVSTTKNLLSAIIVYMAFSLVMSIIWSLLQSPDLTITETAVGAGVTSILMFVALKKIHAIDVDQKAKEEAADEQKKD